jgi:hypothetical protein
VSALDDLKAYFPWIDQLGITNDLRSWAAEPDITVDGLVARLRSTPQYRAALPGIFRDDGTMRMNEGDYLSQRDQYRTLLQQWGRGASEYDNPNDFAGFFANDIAPDELGKRLNLYDQVKRGTQDVKEAFYVYANMKLDDDQLYRMTVNPAARQQLVDEYNKRVSLAPLDYQTWITRATEAGLNRVVDTLGDLQNQGAVTSSAIDTVRRMDPDFARQIADSLYHGGRLDTPNLSLQQLMHSFEYALVGGAATQSGLELPTEQRLDALRQAGVDRAQAAQGYEYIAENKNSLQGSLDRMQSGRQFSTQDFEKAIFLNQAPEAGALHQAQAYEKSLSQAGGGASVRTAQTGRTSQPGLGSRY